MADASPRWWLEELDPDAPAVQDGPIADIDEPPDEDDRLPGDGGVPTDG